MSFAAYELSVEGICAKSFVDVQTSNAFISVLGRGRVVCIDRKSGSTTSNIEFSGHPPYLHEDFLVFVAPSSTRVVPYGGSESPAALDITIRSASDGSIRSAYDVPFGRVSYFPSTLYVHAMGSGSDARLLLSCWDDMEVKVVELISGVLKTTLHQDESQSATVKCIASSDKFIVVGFEWQRYIKLPPLCVYDSKGERLHQMGSGATPKQLQIYDNVLFSVAENAKEMRVWCLESGARLYSVPFDAKIVWFSFREYRLYVAANSTGHIFSHNDLTSTRNLIDVTVWSFVSDVEALRLDAVDGKRLVLIGGKKQVAKRKKNSNA